MWLLAQLQQQYTLKKVSDDSIVQMFSVSDASQFQVSGTQATIKINVNLPAID